MTSTHTADLFTRPSEDISSTGSVGEPDSRRRRVSILIPSWGDEAVLSVLLEDLARQDYPKELVELVLAVGGDPDCVNTVQRIAEQRLRETRVKILAQNIPNKNLALLKAFDSSDPRSDFIVLLDADSRLNSEWLNAMVEAAYLNPDEVIVADYEPARPSIFSIYYEVEKIRYRSSDTPILYGGAGLLIRRQILERVGPGLLFDVHVLVGTDFNMSRQLRGHGVRIRSVSAAVTKTELPASAREFANVHSRWALAQLPLASGDWHFRIAWLSNVLFVLCPLAISLLAVLWEATRWPTSLILGLIVALALISRILLCYVQAALVLHRLPLKVVAWRSAIYAVVAAFDISIHGVQFILFQMHARTIPSGFRGPRGPTR